MASLLVVATLVAGCSKGVQEVKVSADAALSQAAATTGSASMTFKIVATVDLDAGGTSVNTTTGAKDGTRTSMSMEIPVPGTKTSMDLVMDGNRQFLRYVGMPAGTPLPDGWIEFTGTGSSAAITSSASIDDFLAQFKAKDAAVKDLGTSDREGTKVHRYSTTIDLSRSFDTSAIQNRTMKRLLETTAATMKGLATTIEVDDEGHIVRIEYSTKTAVGKVRSVMTMADFGKPVSIELPSDAKQMTMDEFSELVYPSTPASGSEPVDESELISRKVFVEAFTSDGDVTDELAGCIYDELKESNPASLRADNLAADDLSKADMQAMTAAATVCGVSGG